MQVICVLLCRSRSIIHTGRLVMALLWKNKKERKLKKYRKIIIGAPRITAACSTSKRFLFFFSFRFVSVYNGASIISEKRKKKKTHKTTVNKYKYKPLVFISVHVLVVEWGRAVGERRFSWPAPGENVSNDERNDYEIIVMKSSTATKQKQVVKEASRQ